jgi:predicted RNase H-like nuclease (RuvC/YqgF family)
MTGLETLLMWVVAPLISAIAAGFGGWFFGRKKQQVETIDAANTTYNNIINSLEINVNKLLAKNAELTAQIEMLTSEVRTLRDEIELLKGHAKENEKLKKTIVRYEKLLDTHNIDY